MTSVPLMFWTTSQRLLLALLVGLVSAGGLAGCAARPDMGGNDASAAGVVSGGPETEVRRRARTRLELASGYLEHGQTQVALEEQRQAVQIDPTYAEAYVMGGIIYMSVNDLRMAESQFQRAVSLSPRDSNAHHNLGWLQCTQARYSEAQASFQRALQNPAYVDRAKTFMAQGVCEARAGDRAAAERSLLRAYELDAANPVTGYSLSRLLYERGDLERAQFYIRRLNNSEVANAESLWLGILVEKRLRNEQAVQQLGSQLRRRFPQSPELVRYERGQFND